MPRIGKVSSKAEKKSNRAAQKFYTYGKAMLFGYFEITKRGSSVSTEVRGGLATFFAMSYIVVLNPLILGGEDSMGNTMPGPAIAAGTALVAGILTLIMGIWAKHPFAIATGLGVNAFVAVTAASNDGLTSPDVMGLVVIAGLAMVILVLTGFRTAVFRAVAPADASAQ